MTVAITIIAPKTIVWVNEDTPIMFNELLKIPRSRTPKNAPTRLPLPPSKAIPPIIAAASACSARFAPTSAWTIPSLDIRMIAAKPTISPDNV